MEEIEKALQSVLPNMEPDVIEKTVAKLCEIGVTNREELVYVEEKDLLEVLKPIQARKLLATWAVGMYMYIKLL